MDSLTLLKELGLDEKESGVYLALLELGTASVYSIATKAGLKRPTTYLVLDSLEKRGLVSQLPQAKKTLYIAESPEKLSQELHKKESLLRSGLPSLLALHNARKDKPAVKFYQGEKAVGEVYERILGAKEVRFFGTVRDINDIYPQFPKDLMKKSERGEIEVKEIITRHPRDLEFAAKIKGNAHYEQRFVPEGLDFISDNVLFGGRIVFFSYSPFLTAVEISSRDVYESLSALFTMAWAQAELKGSVLKQ